MSVTVELPEHALAKLTAEAARRGVSIDVVIAELAAQLPAVTAPARGRRKLAFAGIGASTTRHTARDVDEILAEGFGQD
jgi:hypothetical protein